MEIEMMRKDIHFVPLRSAHFPLIHRWFNKPHVQAFYSLRSWAFKEVCDKMIPCIQGKKGLKGFILYCGSHPLGYIQTYPVKDHPWENQNLSDETLQEAAGVDLFIGEEAYLRKGIGCRVLNCFLEKWIWPAYRYCLADPSIKNEASMRLFQKCGFIKHKQIDSRSALNRPMTLQLFIKERIITA